MPRGPPSPHTPPAPTTVCSHPPATPIRCRRPWQKLQRSLSHREKSLYSLRSRDGSVYERIVSPGCNALIFQVPRARHRVIRTAAAQRHAAAPPSSIRDAHRRI